jgi:transcriptional regulator with XRE-family HTH domain
MKQQTKFSETLKEFRVRKGLSQNALAQKAGIDPSYVNRLETGAREAPTREKVLDIARALELTSTGTNELLLSADYRPETKSNLVPTNAMLSDPALRLLSDVISSPNIPREEIELLEQQIKMLKRRYSTEE